jgi:hypothetical protein
MQVCPTHDTILNCLLSNCNSASQSLDLLLLLTDFRLRLVAVFVYLFVFSEHQASSANHRV